MSRLAITHLQLISLPVADQDRSREFYVDVLGFDLVRDNPMGPGQRWVQVAPKGAQTSITLVTWFPTMPPGSAKGIVLETDDLDGDVVILAREPAVRDRCPRAGRLVAYCGHRDWRSRNRPAWSERVASTAWVPPLVAAEGTPPMRYGMNPHQSASIVAGHGPRVINGEPSMINYLDALNAFELVREADDATGAPAAASFKHVSPAGAALAGAVDATAARVWRVDEAADGGLLSAYVRARDADPKSSFGDVVALSRPVDLATAEFLRTVICDGLIAPGFEPGTAEVLAAKRDGRFLVLEADPGRTPPATERRDVLGVTIEQDRDREPVTAALPDDGTLDAATRADALLGLVTLRYTQSNSVALVRGGAAIGIGAGQQNRVDCVRLAGAKARTWWLRRHPFVDGLPAVDGMGRQDRLNWQIRFAGREMTAGQRTEFGALFGAEAGSRYDDPAWRDDWVAALGGVTLASDGFLPFRDNVEYAAAAGVTTIVEPGGSARTGEVADSAAAHGIAHVQTGLRLFHH